MSEAEFVSSVHQEINAALSEKEISGILSREAYQLAAMYLVRNEREGYERFINYVSRLNIPDRNSGRIFGLINMMYRSNIIPNINLPNYYSHFSHDMNKVKHQHTLSGYLTHSLDILIEDEMFFFGKTGVVTGYSKEFKTDFGLCDMMIYGDETILLELKVSNLNRKDVYQTFDYYLGMNKEYPATILCRSARQKEIMLAKELGISIYTYTIQRHAPMRLKIEKLTGCDYISLQKTGSVDWVVNDNYEKYINYLLDR